MAMVFSSGPMAAHIMGFTKRTESMVAVFLSGLMGANIQGTIKMTNSTVKVSGRGLMATLTQVSTKTTRRTVMVSSIGLMATHTQVSGKTGKSTVKASSRGLMAVLTQDSSLTASRKSTAKVFTTLLIMSKEKERELKSFTNKATWKTAELRVKRFSVLISNNIHTPRRKGSQKVAEVFVSIAFARIKFLAINSS